MNDYINRFLYVMVFCFLVVRCDTNIDKQTIKSNDYSTIVVDFDEPSNDINQLYGMIDSVSAIPLETKSDFLIGRIKKILFDEDYIYVLDDDSNSLYSFDKAGKAIIKFGNIGRGPGEYMRIGDFDILDNEIVIFDRINKLIFFDKQGGFTKEEFINDVSAEYIASVNSTTTFTINNISHDNTSKRISLLTNGHLASTQPKVLNFDTIKSGNRMKVRKPITYLKDQLFFTDYFKNDVYSISKDTIKLKYRFDFGSYTFNTEARNTLFKNLNNTSALSAILKSKYVGVLDYFNVSENYLYVTSVWNEQMYEIYYDKRKGDIFKFGYSDYPSWFKKLHTPYLGVKKEDIFISIVYPDKLLDMTESEKVEILKLTNQSNFLKYLESIDYEDNPLIILTYLK
ncbi:6-bladed beta-propeller [Zhouia amylolytica]|uniref:6-bladed beta-propeller n=1 Tax=Zhouia amylolytica AD3 TaxID=1286632 RepID=W2USD3_9FLAO|nr:6-bladed beta-propeller [Zhouia amylolytica]ETN96381.1 hypothetical protein P278_07250 [Zhouia amylolytica AD3]